MRSTPDLWRVAARQHALITTEQAARCGIDRKMLFRWAGAGLVVVVHEGVYRMAGAPECFEQRVLAAVLAAGNGAITSHRTAARLWGAPIGTDGPIEVIVPRRGRSPELVGVAVHRPLDLEDLRPALRAGIPCSNPLRTLVDLGAVASWAVGPALEAFLVAGLVSMPAVRAARERHRGKGRRGVGVLAQVIENRVLGDRPADSVLEARFGSLVADHGLPAPVHHHLVSVSGRTFELDYAYPDRRIAIEIDGHAFHADRERFDADRERDVLLGTVGWLVLRFTWLQLVRRPYWVANRLADILRIRGAA